MSKQKDNINTRTLYYENETYQAKKIVKTLDSIIGYIDGKESFIFRDIVDFSLFSLEDGQLWDLPDLTESQILGQMLTDLELKILMMEASTNV